MTLLQMQDALGIEKIPASFETIYNTVKDTFLDRADYILSSDYIRKVLRESGAMLPYGDLIVEASEELQKNTAAKLLICLLEKWILDLDGYASGDYTPPTIQGLGFDFLHLFAALPSIPGSVAHLRSRGVPEDVIAATMKEYDFCVWLLEHQTGKPALPYGRLKWITKLIHHKLLTVGSLKFDFFREEKPREARLYRSRSGEEILLANNISVHKSGGVLGSAGLLDNQGSFYAAITETDQQIIGYPILDGIIQATPVALERKEWECVLGESDPIVCVHIPYNTDLSAGALDETYQRARQIFKSCYPDLDYRAFYTHTWMLNPLLRGQLKPSSNILTFQSKYHLFPCQSKGRHVFGFVFASKGSLDEPDTLPEDTSLQRNLKKLYRDGGYIHEYCGVFL